jgi:NAD(P)-dependent dehydrogenase (short-subunit alcohol dehydrogenase family)
MKDLAGRIAVVTGGGSGMGRELVRQLVAEGASIAMCDVSASGLAETERLCRQERLPQGLRITSHILDVSDRPAVERFQGEVAKRPTKSTYCSTTPASAAVRASSWRTATNGSAPSTSAGAASISARAPSCR